MLTFDEDDAILKIRVSVRILYEETISLVKKKRIKIECVKSF